MAFKPRTSALKAFVSPIKHLVYDGANQVPHSNTIEGNISNPKGGFHKAPHNHSENPKSKAVNQTKEMLEEEKRSKA